MSEERRDAIGSLRVYFDRRIAVMLALGFASGLPNLLIFDTLSAWLREAGLSLEVIGFFSLATLAYSFKFLWAPLVDRTEVPIIGAWLGHRRSWMLVAQGAIVIGLWLIAGSDPAANLGLVAIFAVFTGFSSATQDIVVDAWRIEAAEDTRQGAMAASYQWGYRLAVVVAGAAPLLLAESHGWGFSYSVMAALMGIGVLAVLAAPREAPHEIKPITAGDVARPGRFLYRAFGEPLADFFNRFGRAALLILALVCLYRLSDFVLNIMNPFYLDLGFSKTEIAEVRKVFGVLMSMLGVFLGGWAVARYGLFGPLLVGALAGPASNLVFVWLAAQGPQLSALFVAIGIDNVASGFAGTCLIAYMSSLTTAGFTATQYALFSSLYSLPGKLLASQSGRIVEGVAIGAEAGGIFAFVKTMLAAPSPTLIAAAAKIGVSGAALATGYIAFFFYSFGIGLAAVVLAWIVYRRASTPDM
ncbi:MAG: MFS transporter [Rhodospirillales bacterium]|nr:MFS transporter [Rhodospirillales bacterium]